jgi:hypothetical protein
VFDKGNASPELGSPNRFKIHDSEGAVKRDGGIIVPNMERSGESEEFAVSYPLSA